MLGDRPAYLARVDVHSALASTGLRRLVDGLAAAAGFDAQRPLVGDAHHLVRAVARDLLTADAARRSPAGRAGRRGRGGHRRGARMRRPRDRRAGRLAAAARALDHGVEVIGYWGEAVTSPAQARELIDRDRRPRAGR